APLPGAYLLATTHAGSQGPARGQDQLIAFSFNRERIRRLLNACSEARPIRLRSQLDDCDIPVRLLSPKAVSASPYSFIVDVLNHDSSLLAEPVIVDAIKSISYKLEEVLPLPGLIFLSIRPEGGTA